MAILDILHYPDERLHKIAQPVAAVDERIQQLVKDMAEPCTTPLVSAYTQVDVHEQVVVIDLSEDKKINCRCLSMPKSPNAMVTRCMKKAALSVPGIFDKVHRSETVTVEALNEKGEAFTFDADGLLAICIQHELDHLNGKVFVEHLSRMKQDRIKTKLKKREKEVS